MLRPLVACAALFVGLSATAATIVVNSSGDTISPANCTLRAAIASMNAATLQGGCANTGGAFGAGDLIDVDPGVTTITLADAPGNHLNVTVNALTIQGNVAIERNTGSANAFRVIRHNGTGLLTLSGLTVQGGLLTVDGENGAGVASNGTVSLLNALVFNNITNCASGCVGGGIFAVSVLSSNSIIRANQVRGAGASGGGVFATGLVEMANSNVEGNLVGAGGCGGGIRVGGDTTSRLRVISSYVGGNRAQDSSAVGSGTGGNGGAICASDGPVEILNSELRGNESLGEGGAIYALSALTIDQSSLNGNFALRGGGAARLGTALSAHQIRNSTLYNNSAGVSGTNAGNGGGLLVTNDVTINNSTFSHNRAAGLGGAILLNGGTLSMTSTLVANSTSENPANGVGNLDIYRNSGAATIPGSNNLIRRVLNIAVPGDTLTGDPLLGAMGDQGCLAPAGTGGSALGCPRAVIPGSGSPALNAGANPLNLSFDQRGSGFPRQLGAATDIGAIEAGGAAASSWPINVTVAGSVGGSVVCTPNPVPNGQNATCTATPSAGYVFVAFSGDCTGATCTLANVTAARNVTATFALAPRNNAAAPVPALGGTAMAGLALAMLALGCAQGSRTRRDSGKCPL